MFVLLWRILPSRKPSEDRGVSKYTEAIAEHLNQFLENIRSEVPNSLSRMIGKG
jgi:hypothetical protein